MSLVIKKILYIIFFMLLFILLFSCFGTQSEKREESKSKKNQQTDNVDFITDTFNEKLEQEREEIAALLSLKYQVPLIEIEKIIKEFSSKDLYQELLDTIKKLASEREEYKTKIESKKNIVARIKSYSSAHSIKPSLVASILFDYKSFLASLFGRTFYDESKPII